MGMYPLFIHNCSYSSIIVPCLQLADEKAGREQTHALGQDVLGHDVDESRQQNEGDGGLVDEEEGDELGHGRLEHCLRILVSIYLLARYVHNYHLLWSNLGLLGLARDESWARHGGWANGGGRAESGPREGAEDASVHDGLATVRGQRAAAGTQLASWSLRGRL